MRERAAKQPGSAQRLLLVKNTTAAPDLLGSPTGRVQSGPRAPRLHTRHAEEPSGHGAPEVVGIRDVAHHLPRLQHQVGACKHLPHSQERAREARSMVGEGLTLG